ncbi:putative photosynthetic complex assembly protein PuhE [Lichenicola sp.]|uniref:putative photosynthetic complex assembly protein PuhE n=1 Tax=Lichenicola sp. TaxID=2804529 RepID=UPI003AFFE3FA
MSLYVLPALFALFVWWFSTGVIMYLDGLPRRTFRWSLLGATVLLFGSFYGLWATRGDLTLRGAYLAFTFGLLAWGWQEISFYMGYVTGPRRAPCADGCSGWRHFGHAIQTSLWHELAIIGAAIIVVALTWGGRNQIGTWTFMVLWWMHQSAKLNVFLGVRNLNEEFLPEHLQFLKSFLTKKPMNLLFPVSITISTVILVKLVQAADAPGVTRFDAAGYCFLSTLMALAILEHWLLMLPLPGAALWNWSLRSRKPVSAVDVEVVAGFLGAGKTTVMARRIGQQKAGGIGPRTVVLVNDFAAAGIDGSLLGDQGAAVVELPNGCICCSLKQDLGRQINAVIADHAPDRILIEPSGVADLASLIAVLSQPDIKPMVRGLQVSTVIDAGSFLRDFARMPTHLEAQARLADELILNKTDLVSPAERHLIENTLRMQNRRARIMLASFGEIEDEAALPRLAADARPVADPAVPAVAGPPAEHAHHHHHHAHEAQHADEAPHAHEAHEPHDAHGAHAHGPDLSSWSGALAGTLDPQHLADVLGRTLAGQYGEVERLKGIAQAGGGWVRFDIAGGRVNMVAFAAREDELPRVVAIGRRLDEMRLQAAFDGCVALAVAA